MCSYRQRETQRILAACRDRFARAIVVPPSPDRVQQARVARLVVQELANGSLPIDVLRMIYVIATPTPIADVGSLAGSLMEELSVDVDTFEDTSTEKAHLAVLQTRTTRNQFVLLRELLSVYDPHFAALGERTYLTSVAALFTQACVNGNLRVATLMHESCTSVRAMTYIEKRRLLRNVCEERIVGRAATAVQTLNWICDTLDIGDSHIINLEGTEWVYGMTIGEASGALIVAAVAGDLSICRFLARRFPNIDLAEEALRSTAGLPNRTPLWCAACWARVDVMVWMHRLVTERASKLGRTLSCEERHAFANASTRLQLVLKRDQRDMLHPNHLLLSPSD